MTEMMTFEEFEQLLDDFGPDIECWPEGRQRPAKAFALTKEGKALLAADAALDDMFAVARATGPEAASDGNADAFLGRLADIPVYYPQQAAVERSPGFAGWIKRLLGDGYEWLSPRILASQAATFAAVLAVGVFVGMNSTSRTDIDAETDAIDISDNWFASSSIYDLDEQ